MKLKLILILLITILFVSCSQQNKIEFSSGSVIINEEALQCNEKQDCVLFQPDCGGCSFEAINSDSEQRYANSRNKYCGPNYRGAICDAAFIGEIDCIDNKCTLIP